jgi:hypothetical protein
MDSKWFNTMVDELKAFISLCIIQSFVKKVILQAYWSTQKSTETPFFPSVMSFNWYKLLCKCLHSADNAVLDHSDHLAKVRYPIDYFNNVCERLSFIQFNPTKQAPFGIKYYKICESSSVYCTQFRIYSGQKVGDQGLPAHEAVVMELMACYSSRG